MPRDAEFLRDGVALIRQAAARERGRLRGGLRRGGRQGLRPLAAVAVNRQPFQAEFMRECDDTDDAVNRKLMRHVDRFGNPAADERLQRG